MRFRERLASFFYGRYGADALSKFTLIVYVSLAVVMLFVRNSIVYTVLQILSLLLCVWMLFRMLSRNIPKRQGENMRFLLLTKGVREGILLQRNKWRYRKTHVYRKCPHCKVQIKLPRVAGEHTCTCPKCKKTFDVRIK